MVPPLRRVTLEKPQSNQRALAPDIRWLGMPSLRSCSVGPPPSAIHGRGRLTRHPCRVAHCAEPALGLTRGRVPQQQSEAAYRPACLPGSFDCDVPAAVRPPSRASSLPQRIGYACEKLVGWQVAFASKPAPTGDWVYL